MRVVLIDDHTLVRKGLQQLLESRGIEVAASVGTGAEGLSVTPGLSPDIVLLDVKMPDMNGLEVLVRLRAAGVQAPILMLTMSRDEADLQTALRGGAQGYLLKDMDPEDLVPALQDAVRGDNVVAKELIGSLTRLVQGRQKNTPSPAAPLAELTPREQEILRHLAEGRSNKAIARALYITDGTVKLHVKSILRKLGVRSRVEAAVMAVEHDLARRPKSGNQQTG